MSPISKYFKGHGAQVMSSIRSAHPNASLDKVKSEFYATANKQNATPPDEKSKPKRKTFGQRIADRG